MAKGEKVMRRNLFGLGLALVALMLLPLNADAIKVGTNPDVHFDFKDECANDFHIEGLIHSAMGTPPKVLDIFVKGDPGTGYWKVSGYKVYQPDPWGAPDDWWFEADFITDEKICFCQSIHFGIVFDVNCYNIIIDLRGHWTLDGVPLHPPKAIKGADNVFESDVAVTGFHVDDVGRIRPGLQSLLIVNNTNVVIEIPALELALTDEWVPLEKMNADYLGGAGGLEPTEKAYADLKWIPVPMSKSVLEPGGEELIALDKLGIRIDPGKYLQIRGINNGDASAPEGVLMVSEKMKEGKATWNFFWEQHEAHP
jgi:hypothetical protein